MVDGPAAVPALSSRVGRMTPLNGGSAAASAGHIRFYETTVSVPRFDNTSSQVTVLIIQNSTRWNPNHPISGTIYFWDTAGALLGSQTFSLIGRAALVLNTATVPGAAGVGGTITVTHDGGFDSPGLYKPF
jgi:hypothetical protein